jgi:hypothetical protein
MTHCNVGSSTTTAWPPPCSQVFLQNLTVPQLLKKFLTFNRTWKVHCSVHNHQPHIPVLSQINPVHALPSSFCKLCVNIILPPKPRSSKWFLYCRFAHQNPVCISLLSHTYHMPPTYLVGSTNHDHLDMPFSSASYQFLPLRPFFLSQHPILEHLQPMSFPYCEFHTHIKQAKLRFNIFAPLYS